jgi:hypothetical protein
MQMYGFSHEKPTFQRFDLRVFSFAVQSLNEIHITAENMPSGLLNLHS